MKQRVQRTGNGSHNVYKQDDKDLLEQDCDQPMLIMSRKKKEKRKNDKNNITV